MSEVETSHDVVEDEVHFKEDVPGVESSTPPTPITGWTGKDGSPSPTLGTIIKKSYNCSSILSTSLGSKTLNNTSSSGLGGTKLFRCNLFDVSSVFWLFFQANLIMLIIILIDPV